MAQKVQHQITGGPSKFDLMLALFDGNSEHRRLVAFRTKEEFPGTALPPAFYQVQVIVNKIEREDGSGENWLVAGEVLANWLLPKKPEVWMTFRAFYRTIQRQGWLEILSDSDQRAA